jgi:hypothetical protein
MSDIDIPRELQPYFDFTLVNCLPLCSYCDAEQEFESDAAPCSDAWYLDMAIAIHRAAWVIPEPLEAACAQCAASSRLRHAAYAADRG